MSKIGFMTPDADGRLVPVQFAVPEQVLRGTTDEKATSTSRRKTATR